MATWVLVAVVVIATIGRAVGQNASSASSTDIYGELPASNYTAVSTEIGGYPGLSHLFVMAKGFVDVVFKPFSDLEDPINNIVNSDDALGYLGDNWLNVVAFDAGYVACLVFGLLFFIFVPLVGSIMCCCRCCCGNCGGRLQQSHKRSKSCWRQCLCLSMFVLTTFMAVPTLFVFLTNERITDVVKKSPAKFNAILDDTAEYLNLVPRQLTYMTDQYATVDGNVRPLVSDFGTSIGEPLKVKIEKEAEGSLQTLTTTKENVNGIISMIEDVGNSVDELKTGTAAIQVSLDASAAILGGITCTGTDAACTGIKNGASNNLQLGFNPNDFDSLVTDLNSVSSTFNAYNFADLESEISQEIDDIPQKVRDETETSSDDSIKQLNDANQTVTDVESELPTDGFENAEEGINSAQTSVADFFEMYENYFDKYRYIAGIVLGCILAFVVFCYYMGMCLGVLSCKNKNLATQRGAASNCGGILLMVGVGFSFIFSWLLMLLVIVTFTIGGHGERYGCQALGPPDYEATDFIQNITNVDFATQLDLPEDVTLTLKDVLSACEKNQGVYQAFKLQYLFNITKEIADIRSSVDDVESTVNSTSSAIDFSTIRIYPGEEQQELLKLKTSGFESIDYADYRTKLGTGITNTDLTAYAQVLKDGADNFEPANSAAADTVRTEADKILKIQTDQVEPLQVHYDSLSSNIDELESQSSNFNDMIDDLDESLTNLNESITVNGETLAADIISSVADAIVGNVTSYTEWLEQEVTTTLGACRPVYDAYARVLGLFCDDLIDTINGLWFSLGWCVFFLIPSAIVGMKLMKFFRRMEIEEEYEDDWENLEMRDSVGLKPNGNIYVPVLPNY